MSVAIIIQARLGSTRLPQKMTLPFYEGKNILSILIEKLYKEASAEIILATTTNPNDDAIVKIAEEYNINIYRGSEHNVLKRFIGAAETFKVKKIIRVCADNPFLQLDNINELILEINQSENLDYISYTLDHKTPTIKSHIGLFAEATSLDTLKKVNELTSKKLYQEHVTNFIYNNDEFKVKLIEVPSFLLNRTDLRFTLDTNEDFDLLQELYQIQKKFNFNINQLIDFVDNNNDYLARMEAQIIKNSK